MADVVQYRLERMVEELDDLERRGLFTRREISEIVKQRRKFEYRLKRPSPLKQDYLAYIEYETQLDSLRRLRKKSAVARELENNEKGLKNRKKRKMSVSDFSGIARILEIYRLVVMRFKGDIDLWFKYLEFCRHRKNGKMKKVLAQVIRFHPKVPGVWIYAAAWEFDHNLNVTAARALMQNGLRVCPTSEDLWIEYLRMELTYLNKLKARKVALGEDKGTLARDFRDADEKQWIKENKDLFMPIDGEMGNIDGTNVENIDSEKKLDLFREQGLRVLRTIYSGAVEALPSSLSLRQRFFEILDATNLAQSEDMRKEILSDMKRDFSADPKYWDWLARLEMTDSVSKLEKSEDIISSQMQKAVQVYEEALKNVPSSMMFDQYTKFLMDILASSGEEAKVYIFHFTCNWGDWTKPCKLAVKLCSGKLSESVQLWLLRVSIEVRCATRNASSPSKADILSIFELLRSILTKVSVSEAESLWFMALKFFINKKSYFEKLVEISLISVAKDGGGEYGFSLPSAIINIVLQKEGIQQAREMLKRFLALPRPGLVLYQNCIELELNLASTGDKDSFVNARKLFESALATYDQNTGLWRDYYSMETKLGTSETASAVYWRARKTLKDSAAFTTLPNPHNIFSQTVG
ncbi:U3 small nucleolar RNA-associated protein 6-like [Melia azedarach]|uniref:U3 small nucleolar RNA-associated protein 6-like n=1 Tax=Melia azedarach TaxID=155640 RepID=A0ACC1WYQ9_MELAZ|nr:U3 small nucleolar RNA-associated protein 6-like [Melia azedarach]